MTAWLGLEWNGAAGGSRDGGPAGGIVIGSRPFHGVVVADVEWAARCGLTGVVVVDTSTGTTGASAAAVITSIAGAVIGDTGVFFAS